MKTLAILAAAGATMGTVAATAQTLQHDALRRADEAHAAAAELVALTAPHAQCTPAWEHLTREAIAADNAAAAVQAALVACDFCTARDAADRLSDIADDLQDDVDDLDPVVTPLGRRQARLEFRRIEIVADALEDISDDLRRDTRRLDQRQGDRRTGPLPGYSGPISPGPPVPVYPSVPGTIAPPYEMTPYGFPQGISPQGGDLPGDYDRQSDYPAGPTPAIPRPPAPQRGMNSADGLGPSLSAPPADAFGPSPVTRDPLLAPPAADSNSYYDVAPTAGSEPRSLPPGLLNGSPAAPRQPQKIQQRQPGNGPTLFAPSAMRDAPTMRDASRQ